MPSTRHLIEFLKSRPAAEVARSLAVLDAVMSPDWEGRYYSLDQRWAPERIMGSMRNGQGDHWFALFSPAGVVLQGLAHEAPMFLPGRPWPGVWESLPPELDEARDEPAFDSRNTTFCIWHLRGGASWQRGEVDFPSGDDPDGSAELLSLLDGDPARYCKWAGDYYEVDVPLGAVEQIYGHNPLSGQLVATLNPDVRLADLMADVDDIGYPEPAVEQPAAADGRPLGPAGLP